MSWGYKRTVNIDGFTFHKDKLAVGKYNADTNEFFTDRFWIGIGHSGKIQAWSYAWWQFVRQGKSGTVYFNDYGYSPQTDFHQQMAKNILKLEGIKYKVVPWGNKCGLHNSGMENRETELIHDLIKYTAESRLPRFKDRSSWIKDVRKSLLKHQELMREFGLKPTKVTKKALEMQVTAFIMDRAETLKLEKERKRRETPIDVLIQQDFKKDLSKVLKSPSKEVTSELTTLVS